MGRRTSTSPSAGGACSAGSPPSTSASCTCPADHAGPLWGSVAPPGAHETPRRSLAARTAPPGARGQARSARGGGQPCPTLAATEGPEAASGAHLSGVAPHPARPVQNPAAAGCPSRATALNWPSAPHDDAPRPPPQLRAPHATTHRRARPREARARRQRRLAGDLPARGRADGTGSRRPLPGAAPLWRRAIERALDGEACERTAGAIQLDDERTLQLVWTVTPWHGEDGAVGGALLSVDDVTAEHAEHTRQRDDAALLRMFF